MNYRAFFEHAIIEYDSLLPPKVKIYAPVKEPEEIDVRADIFQSKKISLPEGKKWLLPFYLETQHFLDFLKGEIKELQFSPESAMNSIYLIEQEIKSARQNGETVYLK